MKRVLNVAGSVLGIAALVVLAAALLVTMGGPGERPVAQEPVAVDTSRGSFQPPPDTPTVVPYPPPQTPTVIPPATPTPGPYPPPATPGPTFTPPLLTPTPPATETPPTPGRPTPLATDIVLTLVPPEVTDALTQPTQITTRPAPRADLAVDGNYVVWASYEDGQTSIVAHNLATGGERRISSLPGPKSSPRMSGNYVVWEETIDPFITNTHVIRAYDLATGRELPVGSSESNPRTPDVSGHIVVWYDFRHYQNEEEVDIYGYDLQRDEEFPVVTGPGRHLFPHIDGNWVIYLYWPPGASLGGRFPSQPTLRAHHLRSGEDIELGPAYYRNDASCCESHAISGHRVVWRGTDRQTYLYDLATRQRRTLPIPWAYNELELHGNVLRTGSHDVFNVESGAMLQLFRTDIPFSVDDIATDGQTVAWVFGPGDEEHIYVARFRRLP